MTITLCSGTGVPPVSDLDARFGRAFGSMTVPAACLPRRSGTKAGVLECVRQAKRDAAFLVGRCRQARCSTESVPHAPSRVMFGALAEHSGRNAALRRPAIRQKTFIPLPNPKSTLSLAAQPLIWVDNAFSETFPLCLKALFYPIKTRKTSPSNQFRPKNKPLAATPKSRPAGRKRLKPIKGN